MIKRFLYILPVLALVCCKGGTTDPEPKPGPGPGPDPGPAPVNVKIMSIDKLNVDEEPLDSHAGEEMYSVLEPMAAYSILVPSSQLITNPVYARIKKMHDGNFLLLYQGSQIGSTTYYNIGTDLASWGARKTLFQAYAITTPDGSDQRRYSSADAVVLQNGDILAFVAARANKGYSKYPEYNYISMKRSTDNGQTWGEEEFVYNGTTWEPYMLQLPSGKIQCYFTDTDPVKLNSGTSIVESTDNGKTWTPTGVSNCYKVIRQYKYDNDGTPIYTDQMPSVRMLNDGHTLLGFMEARLEKPENSPATSTSNSYYMMSVVRGRDEFPHLGAGQEGPEDRDSNVLKGAAGYVNQFPSGETVLSCNISNIFKIKLGDCKGKHFQGGGDWTAKWLQVLPEKGYWGSTELVGSHEIVGTMHCSTGIQIQKLYLNHRIDAPLCNITLDGNNEEWKHTQAWFIGSVDENVQTCVRAANDGNRLYFVFDRRDNYINDGDDISLFISGSETLDATALSLRMHLDGAVECGSWDGSTWNENSSLSGPEAAVHVVGTANDSAPDTGYVGELSIPLSMLPTSTDGYYHVMVMTHDGDTRDTFTWASNTNPTTWMLLKIK